MILGLGNLKKEIFEFLKNFFNIKKINFKSLNLKKITFKILKLKKMIFYRLRK